MSRYTLLELALGLLLSPLLMGLINRTKAFFGGRRGQPLFQAYLDIGKLLNKGAVYSRSTSWVFRAAPSVEIGCAAACLLLLPCGAVPAAVQFAGDLVLLIYLLGLMRFFLVTAALDTGSSFEGMGASREMFYATLAEPAILLAMAGAAVLTGSFSLTGVCQAFPDAAWISSGPALALAAMALLIVFLAENARIPFDDPNTHLELTMIHEVMILDYGGPDLAFLLYASCLKLWILGTLLVNLLIAPLGLAGMPGVAAHAASMAALAVLTGVVESMMARLSLLRVPALLAGACAMAAIAFALILKSST